MKCEITLCIFLASFVSLSPAHSEDGDLEKRFEEIEEKVNRLLTSQSNYIDTVYSRLAAFQGKTEEKPTTVVDNTAIEQSLADALDNLRNLSAKVELMESVLSNLQNVTRKVETLSRSFDLMASKVEGIGTSLNNLESDMDASKTAVEGMFVGTVGGAFTISLPSLQLAQLSSGNTYPVAFDWSYKKFYWSDGSEGIKRANVDGTDVEVILEVYSDSIAVDSVTGNIYHGNVLSKEIKVCSRSGRECSVIAANQNHVDDIALHSAKSLMFWTNETSIVKASMDGTNAAVILSEKAWKISVDEDSDRLYWIDKHFEYIASVDLNGSSRKVLLNAARQLFAVAVQGDMVYFYDKKYDNVMAVNKDGGHPRGISRITAPVYDIAFYGSKKNFRQNPCKSSPCSHLCVRKPRSFVCLCPTDKQLGQDGMTCV